MNPPEEIERQYRRFAERECRGYSDLYYRLALAVAADADIIRFIARMPVPQPNLFFASVQFLTGPNGMPGSQPELRALLGRRGDEIAELMRTRRTQTNEVGRCAVLMTALPPGPLALIEVGASAGLCLLLDRFHYDYGSMRLGPPASSVHLRCAVTGPATLPTRLPHVVWRSGLDLRPVDVRHETAVRWLLACVWPDHPERRKRLEAAIQLAKADPPPVVAGDLVDDLPALLEHAPERATLVVFHSAVLSYVSPARRTAFAGVLADASRLRDIVWVSNEAPGVVGETSAATACSDGRFLLSRTLFSGRRPRDEHLALAHPHGAHLEWLSPRSSR
jgi:hypothetical protein